MENHKDILDYNNWIYKEIEYLNLQIDTLIENYFGEDKEDLIKKLENEILDLRLSLYDIFDD